MVECLVLWEYELYTPSFRTVLQGCVEFLSLVGLHAVHKNLFSVFQFLDFVRSQCNPFDLIRDIDMLLSDGYQFVGILVNGNQAWLCRISTKVEVCHTSHVPAFTQVLLVLFRKDVSEIRTVKFRFLSDAVDAQHDLSVAGYE